MPKNTLRSFSTRLGSGSIAITLLVTTLATPATSAAQIQFQSDECPKGTSQTGKAPPDELSQGCTTAAGLREGPWTDFWPAGGKWRVGQYKNGKHHGHWTVFRPNGKKLYEADFKAGFLHGKIVVYYENEQKRVEGAYTFGKANGRWVAYTETGSEVGQLLFDAGNVRPRSKGNPKVVDYMPKRLEPNANALHTAIARAPLMQQVGKTLVSEGRAPAPARLKGEKAQHYASQSRLLVRAGQQLKLYARAIEVLAADAASPVQVGLGEEAEVLVNAVIAMLGETKRSVEGFQSTSAPSSLRQNTARAALKKLDG
jgi:hypothetical protein